ncbi:MAG: phosphotransferase [Actinobacteria bacterium]|nr:phosphotransferase [Actinomycetota bacterium]
MTAPARGVVERVRRIAGARPVSWAPVAGGYSPAERWRVAFDDGTSAFAKVGTNESTAEFLRVEHNVYANLTGSFLAAFLGWDDDAGGERPILLLEDLSGADWPPPWSAERIERVQEALAGVGASEPPPGLPSLESLREELSGWARVAADPRPFLTLGLCTSAWLDTALKVLVEAEAAAELGGEQLLHLDVRSDNVCFAGGRTILVDWNWACVGNATLDIAGWLPSLEAEGGPQPEEILPGEPSLAAIISGYFASHAGLPPGASGIRDLSAAERVRGVQLNQLRSALPWAARALSLPMPAS